MTRAIVAILLAFVVAQAIGWPLVTAFSGDAGEPFLSQLLWQIGGLLVYFSWAAVALALVGWLVAGVVLAARRLCRLAHR